MIKKKIIKRITSINEDQSESDSDINDLYESEEKFDSINEIEDSDDWLRMKIITIHRKRKRMCIISDSESESEIKDIDNEENTVKAES